MYQQYSPRGFNILPPAVKNIILINGFMFLISEAFRMVHGVNLAHYLGLFLFNSPFFRPWQIFTHIFMHADLLHLFFNMFGLWMFGTALENVWGTKRFLIYYFVTALGAAILHTLVNYISYNNLLQELTADDIATVKTQGKELMLQGRNYVDDKLGTLNALLHAPTVGASGAVFGVLLAYGMLFPNTMIYIYFLFPLKAKYFVAIYGLLELLNGLKNDPGDNIAHFAHLGGMLFGFFLIRYWNKNNRRTLY